MELEEYKIKLMKDIERTGFPFEIAISSILKQNDWSVYNGQYYIDKDEGKGREIDIIAKIHKNGNFLNDKYIEVVFSLVIEVKKTEDKPWVFLLLSLRV